METKREICAREEVGIRKVWELKLKKAKAANNISQNCSENVKHKMSLNQ
jgi:hypothetical protein